MTRGDGLYDPLGTGRAEQPSRWRPSAPLVAGILLLGAIALLAAVAFVRDDGERGEPRAVVTIERPAPEPPPVAAPPAAAAQPPAPVTAGPVYTPPVAAVRSPLPGDGRQPDVEIENGVRIVRMQSGGVQPGGSATAPPRPPTVSSPK